MCAATTCFGCIDDRRTRITPTTSAPSSGPAPVAIIAVGAPYISATHPIRVPDAACAPNRTSTYRAITRPRIEGATDVCTIVFAPVR
jgi:hypothetical protein